MGVSVNGNHITITNATIEIINGANSESGVSYIIITPDGGVGALPFVEQGLPGKPALYTKMELIEVPWGDPLPTPNPVYTLVSEGGPGLPSKYEVTWYLHSGQTGAPGSPSILGASDLAASPAPAIETNGFILAYRHADQKFVMMAQKIGNVYTPAGNINATAMSNTPLRSLTAISIPPQGFDFWVLVFASTLTTGTGGATPTRVDLIAYLGDPANNVQLAYGRGMSGANADQHPTHAIPAPPSTVELPGNGGVYGKLVAGQGATINVRAEQKAGSSSNWGTAAAPDTRAMAVVVPVGPLVTPVP